MEEIGNIIPNYLYDLLGEGVSLMKKRSCVIGVILIVLICSMATVFAAEGNNANLYENKKYGFKLEYPEGWVATKSNMEYVVVAITSTKPIKEFYPNVNVGVTDLSSYPNITLERCVEDYISYFGNFLTDFKLVSNETSTLANRPAREFTYSFSKEIHNNIQCTQILTIYNNQLFVITYFYDNEEAKKIISSFSFI